MFVRRLSSLVLAVALVESISFPARAELFKNIKTDGSIEMRSFAIDNETDRNGAADDYRNETNTRLMFGVNFDLLDDVHSRLMLSRSPRFGTGAPSVETVEASLLFQNGYVKVDKVFGAVDVTAGRQFYGDSQDLNIYYGPQNDDLLTVTSADLFRADAILAGGWAKFQGIAGKAPIGTATGVLPGSPAGSVVEDPTGTRGTNHDTTLWGGEVSTDKLIPMGNLAAYWYTAQTHAVKGALANGNNTLSVAGARAGGDILMGFGYQAEFIQNFGRNNTVPAGTTANAYDGTAYFLNVHCGHTYDGRPFRARLEYGHGSDDFVAIAPGRRFGLIWGEHSNFGPSTLNGRAQATGLTNLKVLDAGIGVNPIEKLGVDVNAYRFLYDANLGGIGVSAGTEYDLILSWKHSENVSFEANAATFQVGTALQNPGASTNPITRLGADVKIKY